MGTIDGRFGHVNVTAHDWRRSAAFYTDVFGCELVPPERDIRSADLDAATGLHDAHLTGAHLRPPWHGDTGQTLEIFQYDAIDPHPGAQVDRPGWGHIAYQVPDIDAALEAVAAGGGNWFGEVVTMQTRDGRTVTWVYTTDPDGNIVELQAWS